MIAGARRIATPPWKTPVWEAVFLNLAGNFVNCGHRHRSKEAAERCARREGRRP